jgi:hypothetical protein
MSAAPILWLFITAGGAALLALGLAIGLFTTRRRRQNPIAQRLTDAATREQYRAEEKTRPDRDAAEPPEPKLSVTRARQGVRGHNVSTVLVASLAAAAAALCMGRGLSNIGGQAFGTDESSATCEIVLRK